jgi:molecular chaperone GrpE
MTDKLILKFKSMNREKQKTGEAKGGLFELTVKAVIVRDEKDVLILQRSKDSIIFPGKYDLPGGSVENGETLQEAMQREIEEETGLEVELGPILYAFDFQKEGKEKEESGHGKGIRFIAYYKSGEVKLNDENETFVWLDIDEAIKKLSDEGYERDKKTALMKAKEYLEKQKPLDGWKRCQADFENYKKRQAENQKDFLRYASESMALEIIPVLDNFHVSTEHIPEEQKDSAWVVGIMHIQKQLEKVLEEAGIREIEIKEGDEFDPTKHEAISDNNQEAKNGEQKNKIAKIISKGYQIGEKVIRPARVIVE